MYITHSYKQYLEIIREKRKPKRFKRAFIAFSLFAVVALGGLTSLFLYGYLQESPRLYKDQYLNQLTDSFVKVSGIINEDLIAFQVAGAKVKFIEDYKESSKSAQGYFVTLNDIEKNLSMLHSSQKLVSEEFATLTSLKTPGEFAGISTDVNTYYSSAATNLDKVEHDYHFVRDVLLILGADFYAPQLTRDDLWRDKNEVEIAKYYDKTMKDAETTLVKFQALSVPDNFRTYFEVQVKYLTLVKNVSDNIIKVLAAPGDESNNENTTKLETAFQVLTGARRENEEISNNLLSARLQLFELKSNYEKFAATKIYENSVRQKLDEAKNVEIKNSFNLADFISYSITKVVSFVTSTKFGGLH